jgi:CMP/dCMP kinase
LFPQRQPRNNAGLLPRASREKLRPRRKLEMQSKDPHRVVAIDGPAASGKSSVARDLAQRLRFVYVNSGAMYRAVTWAVLENGLDSANPSEIARFVMSLNLSSDLKDGELRLRIDDVDLTRHLQEDRVNREVSRVSAVPEVRRRLVERMRDYANQHDLVVEGRDIGSVVFPDTPYKFYIDASPDVRAKRRSAQGQRDEIAQRDHADSSRVASPLVIAPNAEVIDTSNLSIAAVVSQIVRHLSTRGFNELPN